MNSEVLTYEEPATEVMPRKQNFNSSMLAPGVLEQARAAAELMASARVTLPKHLQGSPGDCLAILLQATQWGMNPFAVAQKTHVVNGTLGYEAQLVNAVVQASGLIKGRFYYDYRGDGAALECRVGAVFAGENDITWGEWLASAAVKVKNSTLWVTNPRQQLGYLQIKNWARAYAPGAILGVYTPDELETLPPTAPSPPAGRAEQVRAALSQLAPAAAPADAQPATTPRAAPAPQTQTQDAPDSVYMLRKQFSARWAELHDGTAPTTGTLAPWLAENGFGTADLRDSTRLPFLIAALDAPAPAPSTAPAGAEPTVPVIVTEDDAIDEARAWDWDGDIASLPDVAARIAAAAQSDPALTEQARANANRLRAVANVLANMGVAF